MGKDQQGLSALSLNLGRAAVPNEVGACDALREPRSPTFSCRLTVGVS
jgi:hypothetical protein